MSQDAKTLAAKVAEIEAMIRAGKMGGNYAIKFAALGGGIRMDSVKLIEEKPVAK